MIQNDLPQGSMAWGKNVLKLLKAIGTTSSGGATETTLATLLTLMQASVAGTGPLVVSGPTVTATPTLTRETTSGIVAAGAKSVAFANTGASDTLVLGTILKPTETISFSTSLSGETLAAIAYDPQSSELLISKIV